MVNEVFVIANGLNVFHYSTKDTNMEKSELTSGLLSAIQMFTKEARDSDLDYFASADEYFLFTSLPNKVYTLVAAFDKDHPREYADTIMGQIRNIVVNSHILDETYINNQDLTKNEALYETIAKLIERGQTKISNEVIDKLFTENGDLTMLRVFVDEEPVYENARPKQLLNPGQLREYSLLGSAIQKLQNNIKNPDYTAMLIQLNQGQICDAKLGNSRATSFSTGMFDPIEACSITSSAIGNTSPSLVSGEEVFTLQLDVNHDVVESRGQVPHAFEIFLSTFLNAVARYANSLSRKEIQQITIFFNEAQLAIEMREKMIFAKYFRE